jgi:hypothetical protein
VEEEDDQAGVDLGEAHHDALVPLVGVEDLVQEGIQVAERTHEEHRPDDPAP